MAWRNKSKIRQKAIKEGYRSGFESKVAKQLSQYKINPKKIYECTTVPYTVPSKNRTYLVDFTLPKGSKTTYGDFCDKHGITWSEKNIPESWLKT